MYENKCAICGKPIIGYWYEVNQKNICQDCAAVNTVYDLFNLDIVDVKPDVFEGTAEIIDSADADTDTVPADSDSDAVLIL